MVRNPSQQMIAAYEKAYAEIVGRLRVAQETSNFVKVSKQAQLLKQIAAILDEFNESAGQYLKAALMELAAMQTRLAVEDLDRQLKRAEKWHLNYNAAYVEKVFNDTFSHVAGQTKRMQADLKALLREQAQEVFRRAAVEGISRAKAYRLLRDEIITARPDFRFVDKAGRRWDNRKYFEMLTRTVMAQTANDCYVNTLANEGHDLVRVSKQGARDACRNWEGKVLSISGATAGYPTLAEAKSTNEIFHPRCRHTVIAYHPDIDELIKQAA